MLTVHHLGKSQSERVVWLCEELETLYTLKHYVRDAVTSLSPPELVALHPLGTAPVITDGDMLLAESGAIVEYIIAVYGGGRLVRRPGDAEYVEYLHWFHFANGQLQPVVSRNMVLRRTGLPEDNPMIASTLGRLAKVLGMLDARLAEVPYLAGEGFSAADVMSVFSLTTMRYFMPFELTGYPNILAYLQRIAARPAYQRAMEKGDPGLRLLLT